MKNRLIIILISFLLSKLALAESLQISSKNISIDKNKQSEYYNYCKKSNLKISCLSIDIFSADYLARNMFDAESSSDYIVCGVGKNKDDMMIVQNNNFAGLVSFKRFKNSLEIIKCLGSEEYMLNCLNKISHKGFTDFKSVKC